MQMEIHEFELFPRLTALCFTCVLVFFTSFTVFIKQLEPFCTLFEALSAFLGCAPPAMLLAILAFRTVHLCKVTELHIWR
jgi:hypothetical protein